MWDVKELPYVIENLALYVVKGMPCNVPLLRLVEKAVHSLGGTVGKQQIVKADCDVQDTTRALDRSSGMSMTTVYQHP